MPNLRFRTIVFDLDGTIADTAPDLAAALNHALVAAGRTPLSLEQVRKMIGHGTRALLRNGFAATGAVDDALVAANYPVLMRFYEDHICDRTVAYPRVEAAFDALKKEGVNLAVCTNKPERMTRLLIDALGWRDQFATIVAGDTLAVSKPDPAPVLLAIEKAGGGPAAMVGDSIVDVEAGRPAAMVGDSIVDVEAAHAAGLPSVVVSFGFADRPADELGADSVIDSFDALIPTLSLL